MNGSGDISQLPKRSSDISMGRAESPVLRGLGSSHTSFGSLKTSLLMKGLTADSLNGRSTFHDERASSKPPQLSGSTEGDGSLYRSGGSRDLYVPDDEEEEKKSGLSLDRSTPFLRSREGSQSIRQLGMCSSYKLTSRSGASSREDNSVLSSPTRSRQGSLNASSSSVSRIRRSSASFDPSDDLSLREEPTNISHLEDIQQMSPAPALKSLRRANTPRECLPEDGGPLTTEPLKDLYDDDGVRLGRRSSMNKQPSVAGLRRSDARTSIMEEEPNRRKSMQSFKTRGLHDSDVRQDLSSDASYEIQRQNQRELRKDNAAPLQQETPLPINKPPSHPEFLPHAPKDPRPPAKARSGGHIRRASMHAGAEAMKSLGTSRDIQSVEVRSRQWSEPPHGLSDRPNDNISYEFGDKEEDFSKSKKI
ncbi:hypothetical protein HDU67_004048 [Dinochytrium kinnereticum]|nr:hypothetical protein HDU67_004048 [Dinochytrium kinnereticum]